MTFSHLPKFRVDDSTSSGLLVTLVLSRLSVGLSSSATFGSIGMTLVMDDMDDFDDLYDLSFNVFRTDFLEYWANLLAFFVKNFILGLFIRFISGDNVLSAIDLNW